MKTRSPIKGKPLRYAGESLDREIADIYDDMLLKYAVYVIFFLAFAVTDWYRVLTDSPIQPWTTTIGAGLVISYSTIKFFRLRKKAELLKQARDGERVVGEYLERLRAKGYVVFHDIVGDGFNVDHVLLAPTGIYTIETKTWSKPVRGSARVVYDGKKVVVNGFKPDRDPIGQANAQARWLGEILQESTGKKFPVRPVVLFPGWFVEATPAGKASPTWVLNPKALPTFIENDKNRVEKTDLHLAAFHLTRFIRARKA